MLSFSVIKFHKVGFGRVLHISCDTAELEDPIEAYQGVQYSQVFDTRSVCPDLGPALGQILTRFVVRILARVLTRV